MKVYKQAITGCRKVPHIYKVGQHAPEPNRYACVSLGISESGRTPEIAYARWAIIHNARNRSGK